MREGFAAQVTGNAEGGTAFVPMSWTPWDETLAATALPFEPKATFKQGIESLRPVARFAIETATGKNIFRGTDYAENMTVADMARAVPKAIIGQSNTPVDTLLGLRPAREPFRMSQMPSAGAAAARLGIGGALQPVSRQGGLAAEYGNLSDQVRRLRAQIGRAQQANDTALVQSLMVEYAKLQKRMVEMGFPGVPKSTQVMLQRQGVKAGAPAFGQ